MRIDKSEVFFNNTALAEISVRFVAWSINIFFKLRIRISESFQKEEDEENFQIIL